MDSSANANANAKSKPEMTDLRPWQGVRWAGGFEEASFLRDGEHRCSCAGRISAALVVSLAILSKCKAASCKAAAPAQSA